MVLNTSECGGTTMEGHHGTNVSKRWVSKPGLWDSERFHDWALACVKALGWINEIPNVPGRRLVNRQPRERAWGKKTLLSLP